MQTKMKSGATALMVTRPKGWTLRDAATVVSLLSEMGRRTARPSEQAYHQQLRAIGLRRDYRWPPYYAPTDPLLLVRLSNFPRQPISVAPQGTGNSKV